MHVLILSSDSKIFDRGHDSHVRMKEYAGLVDGLDVIVFGASGNSDRDGSLTVHPLGMSGKPLQFLQGIMLAAKIAKKTKFDVVVTQDPIFYGLCGYLISRLLNAKLLVSAYGTNVFNKEWQAESLENRLRHFLGRFVLRSAHAVQADGFEDVEDLRRRLGGKVFWKPIVPSNIDEFLKIGRPIQADEFKVLFVGRLVKQKNIPFLLEVIKAAILRDLDRRISFTIVGDGSERGYLEREMAKLGLIGRVNYIPESSRSQMVGIYGEHQLLILTSRYEGFAKVLMEAAASGMPIVTTKVSGVANVIVNGESGFVVEQGDSKGFVDRIFELAGNQALWQSFSERAKADFSARYGAGLTIDIQKEIFCQLARKNLLILTQVMDVNHGILGFFHRWVEEFAADGKKVTVICLSEGEHYLPDNVEVISLGKEKAVGKLTYLARFFALAWQRRNSYDAVFVHMNQIYVILGWLPWLIMRKPVGLWYAHGSTPWDLRLAALLATHIFTSTPEGCRIASAKVHVIGQGIDTAQFISERLHKTGGMFKILTVGRISPVKDYETLLRAAKLLAGRLAAFEVQIIGGAGNEAQENYFAKLRQLAIGTGLNDTVKFLGPLPQSEILPYLRNADVFVNMSRTGSLDKAILEAMSCELPILTSNSAFAGELGEYKDRLMFRSGSAEELATKLVELAALDDENLSELGRELRQIVVAKHSLPNLISRIMGYLAP